jgi:uncharacterized protein (TIGR00255 family)
MIRSMTGYSKGQGQAGELGLTVALKSINHRFLDIQVRVPSVLEAFEHLVRRQVKERIRRGHVEVTVTIEHPGTAGVQLNRPLFDACVGVWKSLSQELGLNGAPSLASLLRLPGVLTSDGGRLSEQELERIEPLLIRSLGEALGGLDEMRDREGAALEADLRQRLGRLQKLSGKVEALVGRVPECARERLERRLEELLGNAEIDRARLAQEVAYLSSRSDVAEELTRFKSHLQQMEALLAMNSEIGKKMDFILQEMNRESNTLLSKTADVPTVGPEIARLGIEMKSEIEKLREQAQNIE